MLPHLKIKIKSLAAEAAIIRKDERKLKRRGLAHEPRLELFQSLHEHRVVDVRRESRAAQLAYGLMRCTPYKLIEQSCYEEPDAKAIARIVHRFSGVDPEICREAVKEWLAEATVADEKAIPAFHVIDISRPTVAAE